MSEHLEEDKVISEYSQENPRNKKVLFIVLGLLILGGLTFAFRSMIFGPSPEKILGNMITKMSEVESYGFEWKGNFGVVDNEFSGALAYNIKGESDITKNDGKAEFDFNASAEGISLTLSGDAIASGNKLYFRLTTVPAIPLVDLGMIRNQWIKVDLPETDAEEMEENFRIISEKIMALIQEKEVVKIKEVLPDTKINGIDVYHLVVYLDKDALKGIAPDLVEIMIDVSDEGDYSLDVPTEDDYDEFNKFMDKFGNVEMNLFIGKKDFYLYGVNFARSMDIFDISDGLMSGILSMDFEFDLYDFEKEVVVEVPDNYIRIEELMAPMMNSDSILSPEEEFMF